MSSLFVWATKGNAVVLYQFVLLLLEGSLFQCCCTTRSKACFVHFWGRYGILSKYHVIFLLINPEFIYLSAQKPENHASPTIIFPSLPSKDFFFFFLVFPSFSPSVSCPSLLLLCTAKHHYWSLPKHKLKIYPVVICCTVPSIIGGAWQRLHTREEVLEQEAESRTFTRNKKLVTIIYGSCWDT